VGFVPHHYERGIDVYTGLPILGRPRSKLKRILQERGQGLVEYALILALVAIVILLILTWLGQVVFINMYSRIGSGMAEAGG
jgi:Flp pilus assembly pilin Flp